MKVTETIPIEDDPPMSKGEACMRVLEEFSNAGFKPTFRESGFQDTTRIVTVRCPRCQGEEFYTIAYQSPDISDEDVKQAAIGDHMRHCPKLIGDVEDSSRLVVVSNVDRDDPKSS